MIDASGSLGSLFVELTANTASLVKGMNEAKKMTQDSANAMQGALNTAATAVKAFVGAMIVKEIVHFTMETLEAVDALGKFAKETGSAVQAMAELKFAADKANVGEEFQRGMRTFGKALREAQVDGSSMQLLFQQMGVSANQELIPAFRDVTARMATYKDGVDKMGLAQELFATRDAKFLNLLNEGTAGLDEQAQRFRQLFGVDVERAAEMANKFNDSLTDLKTAAQGLVIVFAEEFLPAITEIIDQVSTHNTVWKQAAELLGTIVMGSIKLLSTSFQGIMALAKVIDAGIMQMGASWLDFWRGAIDTILDLVNKTVNLILSGINLAIRTINSLSSHLPSSIGGGTHISEISFKAQLKNPVADVLKEQADVFRNARDELLDETATLFSEQGKLVAAGGEAVKKAVQDSVAPNVELTKDEAAKLKALTEGFAQMRATLLKDIYGIKGMDTSAKFIGNQEEVKVAQKQIDDLKKMGDAKYHLTEEQEKKRLEMIRLYGEKQKALQDAQNILILQTMQKMNDDLLTIAEAFGGKQSAMYKTMFAASKAFAIAESTIKIMQGVAEAAGAPWPLNLAAMASVIAATANIVTSIQAVKLEFGGGKAVGGPVTSDRAFLVGERGPEMFVPSSSGNIIPNNRLQGGNVRVNIINQHSEVVPEVSERQENDERVIEVVMRRVSNQIGSDIRDGKGPVPRALASSFGLRRGQTQ